MQACLNSSNIIARHNCADAIANTIAGNPTLLTIAIIATIAICAVIASLFSRYI
jgi:hypothetical protein